MSKKLENLIYLVGMIFIAILYTYIRLPMLNLEDSFRDWNSDYAIFVMMGEDIKTLQDFPFFYWGTNYLGPLNNAAMALTQWIMEQFGYFQEVPFIPGKKFVIGPLAASLNCMWMLFSGIFFYGLAFKRLFTVWEALFACLLLSVGDAMFIRFSLRPLAPEVAVFLGGLLTWRGISLAQNPNSKNQILFGFLFGFSWWMNQITVFAIVPVLYYFISQSSEYKFLRENISLKSRLFLQTEQLGWGQLHSAWKAFLAFVYFIISLNFLMGFVIALTGPVNDRFWGIKLKIGNGLAPMKTSILIFGVTQFLMWFLMRENSKEKIHNVLKTLRYFIIGFAIGYGPVILGKVFKLYKTGYGPRFILLPLKYVIPYWTLLIEDFYPRLLLHKDKTLLIPFFILFLGSLFYLICKNKEDIISYVFAKAQKPSIHSLLWGAAFFNFVYVILCDRSRSQYAFRYAILTLPVISIYLVTLFRRIPIKVIGITLTLALSSLFGYAKYHQGQQRLSQFKNADTRMNVLKSIIDSDCEVFYSNYWGSYVFEYLLQHEKRFVPTRGEDRTPEESNRLKSSTLKKCDLDENTFQIKEI
jgi:hypothetical protein